MSTGDGRLGDGLFADGALERRQQAGARALEAVFSLARALKLYAPNNAAVVRIINELEAALAGWFDQGEDELVIKVLQDEAFVNGRLLKADVVLYEKITMLHVRLAPLGINEIAFSRGIDRPTLEGLATELSEAMARQGGRLGLRESGALRLAWSEVDAIASYRFEPDRLAVWLYGSLLDLADQLYQQVATGQAPSLLPLRRTMQLVIDNMRSHGAIYQLLASLGDPDQVPTEAVRHVRVAVDMVGFGLFLDLPGRDLMTMGLAGVLGGIARGKDPDASVRALLALPGLGEAAMPLTLLIHDAVAARGHHDSGMPGRALAMVETYVAQTSVGTQHAAHAPHGVLRVMAAGKLDWLPRDLAQAFVAYKGVFPLGSLVRLDDGRLAIVVAQPERLGGKKRPVVLEILAEGRTGARVDLGEQTALRIAGTPAPAQAGLKVSRLVASPS